jgi:hypothetical protein
MTKLQSANIVTYDSANQAVELEVKTKGSRLIDHAFLASSDPVNRIIAASNIRSRNEDRAELLDVIEKFLREI